MMILLILLQLLFWWVRPPPIPLPRRGKYYFILHLFFTKFPINFSKPMNLFIISTLVFILSLPFGYWRINVKKFSLQWFMAIHLPIPFIILFRFLSGTGFELLSFPFTIIAFFLGQLVGAGIFNFRRNNGSQPLSSCLVMDVVRIKK